MLPKKVDLIAMELILLSRGCSLMFPENAVSFISRSTEHKSKDPRNHVTVQFLDKDGNHITTHHIIIPEE